MALKLKTRTQFPALVTVTSPLLLEKTGVAYAFSVDMSALSAILGTAASQNIGTSGANVPLLSTANTWTLSQTFSAAILSTSPTDGLGYATGAGGTVTQVTSKSTGVTLSKTCGRITMINSALAAGTIVSFVLTNTVIAATDVLILNHVSGGTVGSYTLNAQCAAGSATINVRNNTAGSLGEAIVIQFALVKAVTS